MGMTGGGGELSNSNPLISALFHHSLGHQLVVVTLLSLLLVGAAFALRSNQRWMPTSAVEPAARTYLRLLFGAIWLIDGILQLQPQMVLGLANNVVEPMTAGTPTWLHDLMNRGILLWNDHPLALASATAWIQIGIGLLLLTSKGWPGRVGAVVSVGWGLLVWLIGNGAGGIFAAGPSLLFGWPGAVLFYVIAGVFVALPTKRLETWFSVFTLRFFAVMLVVATVLQSVPGAGFWHGGASNAEKAMAVAMTSTAQPHVVADLMNAGGDVASSLGGGFNVIIILWMLTCAGGLWFAAKNDALRWPTRLFVAGAVILWFVTEDAPLWGGLATDLNSMLPMAAIVFCAAPQRRVRGPISWPVPADVRENLSRVLPAIGASMVAVAVVPMLWVTTVGASENTLYLAQNGQASVVSGPDYPFTLTDQYDKPFRLSAEKGKAVVLTFLDPVCWTDCPLLAAQLREVDADLASQQKNVVMVAVSADIYHHSLANVRHFIYQHNLESMKNFYFVTGSLKQTTPVWNHYAIEVLMKPTDGMSIHSDTLYVIDKKQRIRWILPDDPIGSVSGNTSAAVQIEDALASLGVK